MYDKMTLQDFFPADLTLLGLQKQYSTIGNDSFLVNSPCVVAQRKILKKGGRYLIFDIPTRTGITIIEILLIDLFVYEGNFNVISEDINSHRLSFISFCLECPECTKYIVDLNYFHERSDEKAIKKYCGDCDNNKKQPLGKGNTEAAEGFLEFDFE
jgi:hypothetical protein